MGQVQKMDSLEERLREHARSFDGLLSLIPAKDYFSKDTTDQWQNKKQTKAQARAAKMAKLDPANHKSAKDVMDEQQAAYRKRKREEEGGDENAQASRQNDSIEHGKPSEKTEPVSKRAKKAKKAEKKQQGPGDGNPKSTPVIHQDGSEDKVTDKKNDKGSQKRKQSKEKLPAVDKTGGSDPMRPSERKAGDTTKSQPKSDHQSSKDVEVLSSLSYPDSSAQVPSGSLSPSTASTSSRRSSSDLIPPSNDSGLTSVTSVPPSLSPDLKSTTPDSVANPVSADQPSQEDKGERRRRFFERLEALRAARKADGEDGKPARSRQELLDARRRKDEARKASKKEQRQREKEEEARKRAELLATGSPLLSPNSPVSNSGGSNYNLSFGNVWFGDGQKASHDLSSVIGRKAALKGPSDPGTALIAAQKKEARLAGLDDSKREDIQEKDSWLNAKKRAQGERVRDDTNLLKKTLKRKDKQKKKSEQEWRERIEGVKRREEKKQKKREMNLAKRREEKGGKGKKGTKPKNRPGFEGSFRAKHRK